MVSSDTEEAKEDRSELTPEELERFTYELIEGYSRLRGMDFVAFRVKPKHMKMWRQLAKDLRQRNIPGRAYLYWAYKQFRSYGPFVYVEQITSPKTVGRYEKDAPDQAPMLELLIRLQWVTLKQALDEGMTPREIVADTSLELGVVFRFALARHAQLPDLAKELRTAAETEMYFEPLYKKFLTSFLPVE